MDEHDRIPWEYVRFARDLVRELNARLAPRLEVYIRTFAREDDGNIRLWVDLIGVPEPDGRRLSVPAEFAIARRQMESMGDVGWTHTANWLWAKYRFELAVFLRQEASDGRE